MLGRLSNEVISEVTCFRRGKFAPECFEEKRKDLDRQNSELGCEDGGKPSVVSQILSPIVTYRHVVAALRTRVGILRELRDGIPLLSVHLAGRSGGTTVVEAAGKVRALES